MLVPLLPEPRIMQLCIWETATFRGNKGLPYSYGYFIPRVQTPNAALIVVSTADKTLGICGQSHTIIREFKVVMYLGI